MGGNERFEADLGSPEENVDETAGLSQGEKQLTAKKKRRRRKE